ncbi:putative membrane protein [delta proteobacterium NaphS2]|nr:putative membrane protein [delta proteobacterium NaphS2]
MKITKSNITGSFDRSFQSLQTRANEMHRGFFGVSLLLMASLMFTAISLIVKITASTLGPWEIGFARFLFGLIFTLLAARAWKRFIWGQHRLLLIVRGIVSTISFVCLVSSIQMVPLSQATVLFFLFPMFAAIHGLWLNRDPVPFMDWVFILGGFCGALLVSWSGALSNGFEPGHLVALCGAMTAGLALAMVRKLRTTNNPFTLYFYFCLIGTPCCLAPILRNHQWHLPSLVPMAALFVTAILGLAAQLMMNEGVKDVPAHTGGMLLSTQVIFASFAGVVFLGEAMTWRIFLGSVLVVGSGALLSLPKKGDHAQSRKQGQHHASAPDLHDSA